MKHGVGDSGENTAMSLRGPWFVRFIGSPQVVHIVATWLFHKIIPIASVGVDLLRLVDH